VKRFWILAVLILAALPIACVVEVDVPDDPVEPPAEMCPLPRDTCTFEINNLEGTCWSNRCIDGELSLVPKDPGTRCVWGAALGEPPWTAGECNADGICFDLSP
jgi:hypothetical protein